jgi:hypothetical protein
MHAVLRLHYLAGCHHRLFRASLPLAHHHWHAVLSFFWPDGHVHSFICWCRPVKEIAERCEELAKLPNELPLVVRPAFMVERPEPEAEPRIQKACTDLKVVRFQRSGLAIQVVNRMGAAGRLLRF